MPCPSAARGTGSGGASLSQAGTMLADLRFSIRSLARRRGYSAACVATLGVATSIPFAAFALVDAALLRPIPLTESDRVFTLHTRADGNLTRGFRYSELERVLGAADVFEAVAGHGEYGVSVVTASAEQPATVSFVTERFFDVVGLRPALGRGFAPAEHRAGAEPTAVVTDVFWRSRLGGDPAAVGRTIKTGERESVVAGVLPGSFRGLRLTLPVDVFMPLPTVSLVVPPRNFFSDRPVLVDGLAESPMAWLSIIARLKAGVTAAGAEAALNTVLDGAGPGRDEPGGGGVGLVPTARAALPPGIRAQVAEFVAMLSAASGLILLAGCASVAGMMLVRRERRQREMAVRSWLGAGRLRIVRLFLIEALLLTGVGAAAGIQIALWMARAAGSLATLPAGVEMAAWPPAGSAGRLIGAGALAATATGVLCGLVPALQSLHPSPAQSGRWRGSALAGQVAVVVALTIGAGLFVRSMRAAAAADVGFESDGLSYARVEFDGRHDERPARARAFYDRVVERLAGRPGVAAATFGDLPLVGNGLSVARVEIDGGTLQLPTRLEAFFGGPDYVRTLGLRLLAGRDFGDRDVEGREPVAVVSESLARRLWGGREVLGRRFTSLPLDDVRVVGVVDDGRFGGLRDAGGFAVFLPWEQNRRLASRSGTVFGRTQGDAGALAASIAQEVRAFDGQPRLAAAGTFRDRLGDLTGPQRVGAVVLSGLGGFTLLLAMVGVYGSAAQTAAGRARELGIRIALGAGRTAIVGTVLSKTLAHVGIGAAVGVGTAAAFGTLAEPHLFEVGPRDPATYAVMTFAVISAAALAGLAAALAAVREESVNRLIRQATAAE